MIWSIAGVYTNGTTNAPPAAAAPYSQTLIMPQGCDGRINLGVVDPAGSPVDITGAVFTLAARNSALEIGDPKISRQATLISAPLGTSYFPIGQSDTLTSGLYVGRCVYAVWMNLGGARSQVVPWSELLIIPAIGFPTDSVTVPTSQAPLSSQFALYVTLGARPAASSVPTGTGILVVGVGPMWSDGTYWRDSNYAVVP